MYDANKVWSLLLDDPQLSAELVKVRALLDASIDPALLKQLVWLGYALAKNENSIPADKFKGEVTTKGILEMREQLPPEGKIEVDKFAKYLTIKEALEVDLYGRACGGMSETLLDMRIRKMYGSVNKLAKDTGLSQSTLSRHLKDRNFSADYMHAIVKALDIPVDEIDYYFFYEPPKL